jgi:STE24 endopeptidase
MSADPETPCDEAPATTHKVRDLTAEELAESRIYGRRKMYCHLADMVLDVALLSLFAALLAEPLDLWLVSFPVLEATWLRLGVFFLILAAAQYAASFPLALYGGFILEHRFGLSRQTLLRWFRRNVLKNLLLLVFGLVMLQGLFWLIRFTGAYWWLASAVVAFLVSVVLGQLVPVLILPLFYKIEPLEDDDLAGRFRRLVAGTSLAIKGIYRMRLSAETAKANAMLAGLGRTRRVILGDTLLDGFTADEIEVVLAHEVGHHVHRHIPKLILGGLIFSALSFLVCDRVLLWWMVREDVSYDRLPVHALPLLMLVVTILSLVTGPFHNAVSRCFERQSDRYALQETQLRSAYVSAFRKLARLNKADPQPSRLEVLLFHDHPPIGQRLAMAEAQEDAR